jgi:hypothetical protein
MTASYFDAVRSLLRGMDRALSRSATVVISGALVFALGACKDSAVPYFVAPTSVPTSVTGIQNAVTGLFAASRNDQHYFLIYTSAMSRDALVFLSFDPGFVTELAGNQAPSNSDYTSTLVWNREFTDAKQANEVIAALANVPAFTAAQVAAITGMMQTVKALNFMVLAETRDTLGIPIYAVVNGVSSPPYCNKDVWAYIVALLDSGNANLNTAGPIALPVTVPAGFASVGSTAGPSTAQGSFAAFNRALAAKAGLELAYAIARTPSGGPSAPTPATAGTPNMAALVRADSAMTASALYNPSAITPPVNGPFPLDAFGVYHTFSSQSGDLPNPLNDFYTVMEPMADLIADVDTAHDLRWKNKFTVNPVPPLEPPYSDAGAPFSYVPFATTNGPEPIVRAEELELVRAEIQLGLGNLASAATMINVVHQQAGGFAAPLTIASTYTAVRDTLMKELRISTVLEGSVDHLIAIRMWGMAAVSDTTWLLHTKPGPDSTAVAGLGGTTTDVHTTISPIPVGELSGRNGNYALSCSP